MNSPPKKEKLLIENFEGFANGNWPEIPRDVEKAIVDRIEQFRNRAQFRLSSTSDDKEIKKYYKGIQQRLRSKKLLPEEISILTEALRHETKNFFALSTPERKAQFLRILAEAGQIEEFKNEAKIMSETLQFSEINEAFNQGGKSKTVRQDEMIVCWFALRESTNEEEKACIETIFDKVTKDIADDATTIMRTAGDKAIFTYYYPYRGGSGARMGHLVYGQCSVEVQKEILERCELKYPEQFLDLCRVVEIAINPIGKRAFISLSEHECVERGYNRWIELRKEKALETEKEKKERQTEEENRKIENLQRRLSYISLPSTLNARQIREASEFEDSQQDWGRWRVLRSDNKEVSIDDVIVEAMQISEPRTSQIREAIHIKFDREVQRLFSLTRRAEGMRRSNECKKMMNEMSIKTSELANVEIFNRYSDEKIACIQTKDKVVNLESLRNTIGLIVNLLKTSYSDDPDRQQFYDYRQEFSQAWDEKCNELIGIINEHRIQVQQKKEKELCRERFEKREGNIQSIKTERIKKIIEENGRYLLDLYGAALGLNFSHIMSSSSDTDHGHIGSITMLGSSGIGLQMRQTIQQLQTMCDHMEIETGDDSQGILKRLTMTSFVQPHEVAHAVDNYAPNMFTKNTLSSEMEKILLETLPEKFQNSFDRMLKETWIDGLGVNMAISFGTTDVLAESRSARLTNVIKGFLATMEIFRKNAAVNAHEEDYACLDLRFRICAQEFLLHPDFSVTELTPVELSSLRQIAMQTSYISQVCPEQFHDPILTVFRTYFKAAVSLPLEEQESMDN